MGQILDCNRHEPKDNGEGNVGTIIEIGKTGKKPEKTVLVQWDCGTCTNYRVGREGAYDLLVLDSAPAGMKHPSKRCKQCTLPIRGTRWQCRSCPGLDLCTRCYMRNEHEKGHCFTRFDCSGSAGQSLPPRSSCKAKIQSRGLYPGARVVRGCHWQWKNQDGGKGSTGRITELRNGESPETGYSVARVKWDTGFENIYRVGHSGKVDLRYVEPGKGMTYYREHLPKCGAPPVRSNQFAVGDRVCVTLSGEVLKSMQEGHGGWNSKMASLIGKVGHVHRITTNHDVRVQYDPDECGGTKDNCRWTFHPAALQRVSDASTKSNGSQALPRDAISSPSSSPERHWSVDSNHNKTYGHPTSLENDFSSLKSDAPISCVVRLPPSPIADKPLPHSQIVSELFEAIRDGDVMTVRNLLKRHSQTLKVDEKQDGKHAILAAAENGKYDVIKYLLRKGADVNVRDSRMYTVLHHLILWYERNGNNDSTEMSVFSECVKQLLTHKFDVKVQNDEIGGNLLHFCLNQTCNDGLIDFLCTLDVFDYTTPDKDGWNVLHLACSKGRYRVSEMILNSRSDLLDVATSKGFTPLHVAAMHGHCNIARSLVNMKANLAAITDSGDTALHLACKHLHVDVVELLVSHDCNVNAKNKHEKSCVELVNLESDPHSFVIPDEAKWLETRKALRKHNLLSSDESCDKSLALVCFLATCGANVSKVIQTVTPRDLQDAIIFAAACSKPSSQPTPSTLLCTICDEEPAVVLFKPCGHTLYCQDCSIRMKKCLSCNLPITEKTVDGELLSSVNSYKELQNKVTSLEEEKKCPICMERDKDTAFQPCGHLACCECAQKLLKKKCPMCRKVVRDILKTFS